MKIKGIIHPKVKILPWSTHPHVVPNYPFDLLNYLAIHEIWLYFNVLHDVVLFKMMFLFMLFIKNILQINIYFIIVFKSYI